MDQFGEGVEAELEHDIGAVGFGGVDADGEKVGHFFIGFAFGEELKNFAFTGSEPSTWRLGAIRERDGGVVSGGGESRGEVGLVLAGSIDSGEEDAVGFVFEDVAASASLDDLLNEVVGFVHGEDENFGIGGGGTNAASGFDAVEERHADVEDGDVGLEFGGFFDGVAAVGGFGADFPAGAGFEESAKARADDGVIIRDQDAQRGHRGTPSGRKWVGR